MLKEFLDILRSDGLNKQDLVFAEYYFKEQNISIDTNIKGLYLKYILLIEEYLSRDISELIGVLRTVVIETINTGTELREICKGVKKRIIDAYDLNNNNDSKNILFRNLLNKLIKYYPSLFIFIFAFINFEKINKYTLFTIAYYSTEVHLSEISKKIKIDNLLKYKSLIDSDLPNIKLESEDNIKIFNRNLGRMLQQKKIIEYAKNLKGTDYKYVYESLIKMSIANKINIYISYADAIKVKFLIYSSNDECLENIWLNNYFTNIFNTDKYNTDIIKNYKSLVNQTYLDTKFIGDKLKTFLPKEYDVDKNIETLTKMNKIRNIIFHSSSILWNSENLQFIMHSTIDNSFIFKQMHFTLESSNINLPSISELIKTIESSIEKTKFIDKYKHSKLHNQVLTKLINFHMLKSFN